MRDAVGYSVWMPAVAVAALLFLLVFSVAAVSSNTMADLVGLFYLMAAPFLHRWLQSAVGTSSERTGDESDGPARVGAES